MGFPRQQYWSGLPYPPPGDLPNPGIEPVSLMSNLHWQVSSVPLAPPLCPWAMLKPRNSCFNEEPDIQTCGLMTELSFKSDLVHVTPLHGSTQ